MSPEMGTSVIRWPVGGRAPSVGAPVLEKRDVKGENEGNGEEFVEEDEDEEEEEEEGKRVREREDNKKAREDLDIDIDGRNPTASSISSVVVMITGRSTERRGQQRKNKNEYKWR
eukprot:GEMP01014621.1.p2 GENE.GEMP01014621.1~~GEMP01014621.1.p2  ORF type:complete len:115 (+),score=27.18 GEMP01014621.1:473-817(+)